ncbi:molecular chaperone [Serratia proteamaculans]|uniref:fimbrial biogenesis chaperone n=1 Tax=Serratia proteamaculans TaxID=28151 RepID=UPI001C56A243|nr:molecular chaperone [Serratia proteamaculans]WEO87216.1 molecular chaperone [Serratia proteamaculans]
MSNTLFSTPDTVSKNKIAASLPISLGFCILMAYLSPAQAASLRISPVNIEMQDSQKATALSLTNSGTEAVSLQLRAFAWSQQKGQDHLAPTSELMISPPAVTVPAGASYTVRVARTAVTPAPSELSYRLLIDELPRPIDPRTLNPGISMILRTSLPVFVVDDKAFAQLVWRTWQDANGVHAEVHNAGRRHAKISQLTLNVNNVPVSFGAGLNGYVLAGTSRQFTAAQPNARVTLAKGQSVTLRARDGYLPIEEILHAQ